MMWACAFYTQEKFHQKIEASMWTQDGTDRHVAHAETYKTRSSLVSVHAPTAHSLTHGTSAVQRRCHHRSRCISGQSPSAKMNVP